MNWAGGKSPQRLAGGSLPLYIDTRAVSRCYMDRTRRPAVRVGAGLALMLGIVGCGSGEAPPVEQPRPVRVITVAMTDAGETVSLSGEIEAQDEVNLSFRVGGRMIERAPRVGDRVEAGQVVARLERDPAENGLRTARADYAAAVSQLAKARGDFERQDQLLRDGWTTRARHDQALDGMRAAQARVDAAQAQVSIAEDNLFFTELVADAPGAVTTVGAEPGEVIASGQMVLRLAREGGRDAVFDVPAQLMQTAPPDPLVMVALTSDPSVQTTGRVREVAPQADPVTRTFEVRIGLIEPPPEMRLGSTVTGSIRIGGPAGVRLPHSALTSADGQPAVWVVDAEVGTVSLRNIDVERYDLDSVIVEQGLQPDEIVVTAGVQALHPGQQVRLLGGGTP
jgi:membrane fusion protein, multidrug efflux system